MCGRSEAGKRPWVMSLLNCDCTETRFIFIELSVVFIVVYDSVSDCSHTLPGTFNSTTITDSPFLLYWLGSLMSTMFPFSTKFSYLLGQDGVGFVAC